MTPITAACIQLNSGQDIEKNLNAAEKLIRNAAGEGAELIATPEVTDQVVSNRAKKMDLTLSEEDHPGVPFFSGLAAELGVHLLIGSMCIRAGQDKIANRSFLFSPEGAVTGRYDKIHLYDVDLPGGESHRESKIFKPGGKAVLADAGQAKIGLSVCYDLRFPQLYRALAKTGADILTIPAAFTVPTGRAHWEVLLRARAIETGCFVLAPAQSGDHEGVRNTYGHSMIIGPWGEVLAELEEGPGFITAGLDLQEVKKARHAIPALQHDREFDLLTG